MKLRILCAAIGMAMLALPATAHARSHHHRHHGHTSQISHGGLTVIQVAGRTAVVNSAHARQFRGFLSALASLLGHLPAVGCYSSGHMANSKHHWGGACDIGQVARNVAPGIMYHVTGLAHRFGLKDGCEFSHPDCGHVEVPTSGPRRYAHRHRAQYAMQ